MTLTPVYYRNPNRNKVKMQSNLEKYRKDLDALIKKGEELRLALAIEHNPTEAERQFKVKLNDVVKVLTPKFKTEYQSWYSVDAGQEFPSFRRSNYPTCAA